MTNEFASMTNEFVSKVDLSSLLGELNGLVSDIGAALITFGLFFIAAVESAMSGIGDMISDMLTKVDLFQGENGNMASLALQAATAAMVFYMVFIQGKEKQSVASSTEKVENVESVATKLAPVLGATKKSLEAPADDGKRSIRGENVYGPYKKVSFGKSSDSLKKEERSSLLQINTNQLSDQLHVPYLFFCSIFAVLEHHDSLEEQPQRRPRGRTCG